MPYILGVLAALLLLGIGFLILRLLPSFAFLKINDRIEIARSVAWNNPFKIEK